MSNLMKFIYQGVVLSEGDVIAALPKKVAPARLPPEPKHNGFAVVGYPPGTIAEAERFHASEKLRFDGACAEDKVSGSVKDPGVWSEVAWLKKHPPRRVAKSRATPGGASALADLAVKEKWEYVRVVELITGQK
jgi:hypothetical protein